MKMNDRKKLKIAMLGQKTVPAVDSSRGGVEVVVEELATRLVAMGNEVTCYNRGNCDNGNRNVFHGVVLKKVPTIPRKGLAAASSSFFAAVRAALGQYDVVHFHAEGPCAMMWIPHLFHKKCVCTIHGLDYLRSEKWTRFARKYIHHGEKNAVRYADSIIVLSKSAQDYFMKTYGRKTVFIPNGVSRPKVLPAELIKKKYGLEKDSYILFLGRIVPEKGLRYLVDAYLKLNTNKKLVIAGAASDTAEFATEIGNKTDDNPNIICTGFVNGQLKEELYSNAYIYVLPSDLEGMPLSLLEAMSYGNCCIVSDIKECTEVVEDKAVIFHKGDIEDLRSKIQELCDNPKMTCKYKQNAADYICNKYSWDYVAKRTLEIYYEI
jgi:glycosyltransferase involved in cell wall biosynthesis